MRYNPQKHHRRSIRLKGYDYSQPGAYFVTLVAHQREALFGKMVDGVVNLNGLGSLAMNEWCRLGERFENVIVDEFIVMPNHLHGVLFIQANRLTHSNAIVGAGQKDTILPGIPPLAPPLPNAPGLTPASLGVIVGAYKSKTARLINGLRHTPGLPVWQRNYYEHIVRDEAELNRIRQYIQNNPLQWAEDRENPARSG